MQALLVQVLFKSGLILGLAWAFTRLMRHRSAAARHLVWTVALLLAALLPLASRVLPAWTVRVPLEVAPAFGGLAPANAPVADDAASPGEPAADRLNAAAPPAPAFSGVTPPPARTAGMPLDAWMLLAWGLVASLLLLGTLSDLGAMARLTRSATPLTGPGWGDALDEATRSSGVGRRVRLLGSERISVPMTWGLIRPVILLPQGGGGWSAERRHAVLLHELAHVARWDYATQLAARLCCALYWFNPLVWVAARALRSERERACDDRVLAAGARASAYAGELLELARSSFGDTSPGVALAMARRSELEGRLLAILNPAIRRESPGARSVLLFAIGALAVALPLAAFRPAGPGAAPEPRAANPPAAVPDAAEPEARRPTAPRATNAAGRQTTTPAAPCDRIDSPSQHSHSM
ncbi:MAG TPA: M56 family metallopeptidase, partial [Gemmatimonadales bacterium]|nr:M56 family metallopeptidase [Gemmatimonadales bacterium]